MGKIIAFGELLLRLAAPGYTRLFQKDSLEATFCGGEANAAVSLALFGLDSAFVTKLPDGPVGAAAANSLRYFGVDTSKIVYGQGRMGLYYLEKGASQRPSKVLYDRAGSTIALARREEFDWEEIFRGADWFHFTGINPALSQSAAELCLDACKTARALGLTISCDLNYRSSLWSREQARQMMPRLMPYVDVCIGNEEDADQALDIRPAQTDVAAGRLARDGYRRTAEEICRRYGCKQAAFTLRESHSASRNGWSAMLYRAADGECDFSREYDIQIVDRVGGGDSFAAALIYSLITGKDNREAVEFAAAASCLKHTIEGDYNRITAAEVEKLLQSGGNGRIDR